MRKCVPQDLFHRFRGPEPVEGPGGEETPVAGEGEELWFHQGELLGHLI